MPARGEALPQLRLDGGGQAAKEFTPQLLSGVQAAGEHDGRVADESRRWVVPGSQKLRR